jgi:lipopolysaccharide/colanic/teichoic acid biosynthesis glycosyltransferase
MQGFYFQTSGASLLHRQLLLLGFEDDFDLHILGFPHQSDEYVCTSAETPRQALLWLEDQVRHIQTYQLPFAILCRLSWLKADGNAILNQLRVHPDLRYIPIVALAERDEHVDRHALQSMGVDDCYTFPVDWSLLERRLLYLNEYKISLFDCAARLHPQSFKVNMPFSKRLFDVIAASFGVLLAAPVCLLIAIAIKLESKGPIFYRSKRAGAGYHIFDFLKFRSMYQDADQRLKEFADRNQYGSGDGQTVFIKFANDPRITRVGRFIRKYSLDELPQLWNILRGDMSVVGNRPLPLYEAEQLTSDEWCARFLAPAGLTGLWQVTKRGKMEMSVEERIALDIAYSENYNVWTDFLLIVRTFTAFVQHENV